MTPKQKHVTFDLETLGNTHDAPIVQMAAVEFDLEGKILKTFSRNVTLNHELNQFTVSYSTIKFWMEQSKEVQDLVFNLGSTHPLVYVLTDFQEWCDKLEGKRKFWSHATFDPVILKNAYNKLNLICPIYYGDFVDIRTLNLLAGDVEVEENTLKHDALSDCIYQARYISAMLRKLYKI